MMLFQAAGKRARVSAVAALFTAGVAIQAAAQGAPSFTKAFVPSTIGPGSSSRLGFIIDNGASPSPATGLAFVDNLPAGVTIAAASDATSTCDGIVTAPAGGGTITFSGGMIGAFAACEITVNVTGSTPGTHTNTSGDLTSSAGNSGSSTADLTVATDRPGFTKAFAPGSISWGARTTLTFTIDNTANASQRFNLTFSDVLPDGMLVASPPNRSTTCSGGVITAEAGSGVVGFSGGASVAAGSSCTVSVDVTGGAAGQLANTSGELTSTPMFGSPSSSGFAGAVLDVTIDQIALVKSFLDDPVPPGETATLQFEITNRSRGSTATGIALTDDLDATLSGLSATSLPSSPCGAGSSLFGTSVLELNGGSLGPGSTCTFAVTLQVPAGAAPGGYLNATGPLTATVDGGPFVGSGASDVLFVQPAPRLTKDFTDDPVGGGGAVVLEFTIVNTSATSNATGIAFDDILPDILPSASSVPANGFCGAGSTLIFVPQTAIDPARVFVSGASLAPGGSCTFAVTLDVVPGAPEGVYPNLTGTITAVVDGIPYEGPPAGDDLVVVGAPTFRKQFTDDPVQPGAAVTLEFTLERGEESVEDAVDISFTDNLDAVLSGLVAIGLPMSNVCGAGSQISGTSQLSFAGGSLSPGDSCTFSVTLQTPAATIPGSYTNTTSNVTATVGGVPTAGQAASDDLQIAGLALTKAFLDDPVIPGDTVTLRFSVENSGPVSATDISFTDNLAGVLSGLAATGLPISEVCGAGSVITGSLGNTRLDLVGGSLGPGETCTFDVTLVVPAAAESDTYGNTTSALLATINGSPASLPAASDQLTVDATLIHLAKEFTDDPVAAGGTANLRFTITNLHASEPISGITFTDNLDAALAGLEAVGLPLNDICGAGSQLSGTSLLAFTGGALAAEATCTFEVTVQVPAGAPDAGATNTTSGAAGTVNGLAVTGAPASDDLVIQNLAFSKAFSGATTAGQTVQLTFTLEDFLASRGRTGLGFVDDLGATLPGLMAVGLPANDVCGAGSSLNGTSMLTFTGGSLEAGGSCTIDVTLQVPLAASSGSFLNTTSELFASGLAVAGPAVATLLVEPPPEFGKAFSPSAIAMGAVSTLTFTIDNTASSLAATNLDFTDNLPAGIVVANPANASSMCVGGTLTAVPGSSIVSYSGGSVPAGAACALQVDVNGTLAGSLVNTTGDLTSSAGISGTATAVLDVVVAGVTLTKTVLSNPVLRGSAAVVEFTVAAVGGSVALTDIGFTDDLGAALSGLIATGLPATDVCGPGSQLAGSSLITLSGGSLPAGGSCTFDMDVDIPADAPLGVHTNTTSQISAVTFVGTVIGAPSTADLEVVFLGFEKAFGGSVGPGDVVDLTFTITNPDPIAGAVDIAFTDDLDATLPGLTAVGLPRDDVCGSGSQVSGTSVISLTGGNLGPGASCSFDVQLLVPATAPDGIFPNVTSTLSATVDGSPVAGDPAGVAMDDLDVRFAAAIPAARLWSSLGLILLIAVLGARRLAQS